MDRQAGLVKWDKRFVELAEFIAQWSKDTTKVGAVITDSMNRIVSIGFNGLPRNVEDLPERIFEPDKKMSMIVHAEMNAILFAQRSLWGLTLYTWPFAPCSRCASMVVQAGIYRVVAPPCLKPADHWMHPSIELTRAVFIEAGVELTIL